MVGRQLFIYLLPNLAQIIASFGTVFVLTRFLTPEQYGMFTVIFTTMTIVHYIFFNWAEAAALRFYSQARENGNVPNHFATLLFSYLVNFGLFLIAAAILTFALKLDDISRLALIYAFLGNVFRSLLKIAQETRRMDMESLRYALVEGFHVFFGFVFGVIAILFYGMKQDGAFIGTTIAAWIAMGAEAPSLIQMAKGGKFDKNLALEYLRFGYPISLSLIATIILNTGDRLIMEPLLGAHKVGIYSAGYQVAARITDTYFAYVTSAMFPVLVNAYESKDEGEFAKAAKNEFALRLGLGGPVAFGIALVAQPLCEILIGPSMRDQAAQIVPFIAFSGLLSGISDYFTQAFILSKHVFQRTLLLILPVVVNIGLNLLLLPRIGVFGAVYATMISYSVSLLLMYFVGRKYVKMPVPLAQIGKIILALLVMSICVFVMPRFGSYAELALKALVGIVSYGIMAYLLNIADARAVLDKLIVKIRRQNIGRTNNPH